MSLGSPMSPPPMRPGEQGPLLPGQQRQAGPPSPLPPVQLAPKPPQVPGLQAALDAFTGMAQPDYANLANQRAGLQRGIGDALASRDMQLRFGREDYANQMARNGLGVQGLGVDRAAAQRAGVNVDALMALAGQMLQNQLGSTRLGADIRTRGQKSDATARGAFVTQGNRDALSDISKQLGFDEGRLNIGYQQDMIGLKEQKAQAADRNKQLDMKAKELGLQRNELKTALQQGIERLNMGAYVDVNSIMDKLASTDIQERTIAEQIYRQALDYAGVFASNPAIGQSVRPPKGVR